MAIKTKQLEQSLDSCYNNWIITAMIGPIVNYRTIGRNIKRQGLNVHSSK